MDIDNLTGNMVGTNNILEIEEIIIEARRMNERRSDSSWSGTIKYMLWNATGLMPNLDRVVRKMEEKDILLCFVTETWLHPERAIPAVCRETSAVCMVHPVGYERGKNGVSVIINPRLQKHPIFNDFQVLARDTINGTYIFIQMGTIKILCVYHPPSHPDEIDTWLEEIMLKCGASDLNDLVLLGDFNARCTEWGDHYGNSKGRCLKNWIEAKNMNRVDTGSLPTFVTTRGNSIVDHVFANIEGITAEVGPALVNVAGHRPIFGTIVVEQRDSLPIPSYERLKLEGLKDTEKKELLNARLTTSISYFKDRLNTFNRSEAASLVDAESKQCIIDEFDKHLTECIMRPAKEILGVVMTGKKQIRHETLSSANLEALEAAMLVVDDMEINAELMKKASNELQRLRKQKFELFADEVSSMSASDMMKITSAMITNRKKQQLALNSSNESLASYRNHFATMNTNRLPSAPTVTEPIVLNLPSLPLIEEMRDHVSPSAIALVLKWISWNKSPGASGLSYDILKVAPYQVLEAISEFFKLIISIGCVPSSWKRALIVPVPKKGDLCLISNYRPISLTEPLRKILEHCILKLVNKKVGPSFLTQGGFRTNHCCNDMIVILHEAYLKYGKKLNVAFLDIRAAYDSVDRRILWRRCRNRGLSQEFVELLKQMFDHNSGQVVVGGRRSNPFHIESGVLQGSVLSPCLYSIFIDDLAYELSSLPKIKVGSAEINCIMYADDIALFSDDADTLQVLLNKCAEHATANRYRFNTAKCEVISARETPFTIDGSDLPFTDRFKYLGVEFTDKGIDHDAFVKRRCEEAMTAANRVIGMGMNVGGFSPTACSRLYKVFIRPKLEASMCILPPLKKIYKQLERTQCGILRRIIRAGKTSSGVILRSIFQMPSMKHRVKWLRTRYTRRYRSVIENEHILRLVSSAGSSWINRKLMKDVYEVDISKEDAWKSDLTETHDLTRLATGGQLNLEPAKYLPWFLRVKCSPTTRRPIINWILKRYPGRDPPTCANCLDRRATQEHISTCANLYTNVEPTIPPRFRPEHILSKEPTHDPKLALFSIARRIAAAVNRAIPDYDFEILQD